MLGGCFLTTAWSVVRLRMEKTVSRCGGYLRLYWISSDGQPKRGGPLAGGLCLGLTSHFKK
jgi:hypothetical protein